MSEVRRFSGGRVVTGSREVEAFLVAQGRVVLAGTDDEVRRASPTGTEATPLEGRLVIPGLVDAHLHLGEITRAREGIPLEGATSLPELLDRTSAWAAAHPGRLVFGRGWSVDHWPDPRPPTARDLERVVPDRPAVLVHASGHAAVLNRAALDAVGYRDGAIDPPGGRVGRETNGQLTGLLYETALTPATRLLAESVILEPAELRRTMALENSFGVTTVGTMNTSRGELEALRALLEGSPPPTLRVRAYVRGASLDDFTPTDWSAGGRAGWLAVPGVKAFADGAFGPRTAWLEEPYADQPGELGVPVLSGEELEALFRRCAEEGWQPAVHTIGDRAIRAVLEALAALGHRAPARPRIEHASLVPPGLAGLLSAVRPALVVQPGFVWSDDWLVQRLGARGRWAYPFQTLLARGHLLAGSTDAPFEPSDVWRGIAAGVHRVSPSGGSANPIASEALSPTQALALFTGQAGRALREPDLGSLESPSRADFVVLEARDWEDAVARGAGCVRETWVGGRCVYAARGPAAPQTI